MDKSILTDADLKAIDGTEKEFRTHVATEMKSVALQNADILADQSRWTPEIKKAVDAIDKLQKNDMATLEDKVRAIEKQNLSVSLERSVSFKDPIKRFAASEAGIAMLQAIAGVTNLRGMAEASAPVKRALSEASGYGSIEINTHLFDQIYDTLLNYGQWSTLGVIRVGTRVTRVPIRTARNVANFILTEGNTIADDTNFAGSTVNLQVEFIASLLNVSLQLIQDGEIGDVIGDLMRQFVAAVNNRLDYAAFAANGTADVTNGGMTGISNFGTASVSATGQTTIETTTLNSFINALTVVDPVVLARDPKWWMHPTSIARTLAIKDTVGHPIFMSQNVAPTYGGIGSILGYAVIPTGALSNADVLSTKFACFGDPQAMAVGVRTDMVFEYSDQATWNSYQRSFRGTIRAGVKGKIATGFAVLTTSAT